MDVTMNLGMVTDSSMKIKMNFNKDKNFYRTGKLGCNYVKFVFTYAWRQFQVFAIYESS